MRSIGKKGESWLWILIILAVIGLVFIIKTPQIPKTPKTQIPNPAAVYCVEQGYKYEIRTNPEGSQYGVCIFPDGSECEEWSYFCGCTNDKRYCGKEYPECPHECGIRNIHLYGWINSCNQNHLIIMWEECPTKPICSAIGTRSEGWYCNNNLIMYDLCSGCYAELRQVIRY